MAYTLFDAFGREPVAQTEDELAANARPVTQTIKTNPVTGEQTMTVSGSPQDLSAANPLTPTVSPVAPAAPVVGGPMRQPVIESTALPAQTIMPVMPNANPTDDRLAMGTQTAPMSTAMAPTPMTRAVEPTAAPMAAPTAAPTAAPMAAPVAAPIPQAPAPIPPAVSMQPAMGAASEGTAGESDAQMQMRNAGAALAEAGSDPRKLTAIYNNSALPESIRSAAADTAMRQMQVDQGQKKVQAQVKEAIQTGDMRGVEKLLKQQGDTGSIAKAFLFSLIGFKSGAEAEVAKMNLPKEWKPVTDDAGKTSLVLYSTSGMPLKGLRSDGSEMQQKELIGLNAKKAIDIVGGTYINDATKEVGRVITDKTSGVSYIQTDEGRKPMAGFRPQSSQGSLGDMNTRQLQELRNKLDFAGPSASVEQREKIIAESEAKFGLLPEEYKAQVRGAGPRPPAAPAAAATPTATGATPVAPTPVSPAAAAAAPTAVAPTPVAATTARPTAGGGGGVPAGGSPAQREAALSLQKSAAEADIQRRKEMRLAEEKPAAAAAGADAATTVKNQAFADRTYDLIKPINQAILQSTGSSIGAGVDTVAAAFGKSTKGSEGIARLNVLSYGILANIPRFEGPQSDIDVQMYKQAAGDFANRKLPVGDRLAALDALNSILKRYDRANKNDWTFGAGAAAGGAPAAGAIKNVGGVDYIYDGTGWKKK
jgi:hypothetical protein